MSQSWVFRKDDYEKMLHKIKVLSERVAELEKRLGAQSDQTERGVAALRHLDASPAK